MSMLVAVKLRGKCQIRTFRSDISNLRTGEDCIVESNGDRDYGRVLYHIGPLKNDKRKDIVVRKSTPLDLERFEVKTRKEQSAFEFCLENIREKSIPMKLLNVRFTFEEDKAIFYFTAEKRVDFRELVKELAHRLRIKIEMQQIGVRDEAKMLNGYGPCGKHLCCSQFMTEFDAISIKMAKAQGLSLVPTKISGSCNRLKCCLKFEFYRKK